MQSNRREFLSGLCVALLSSGVMSSASRAQTAARDPGKPMLGLIFPPSGRGAPDEGLALYGDTVQFLVEGLGLETMTPAGYDAVLDRIGPAAVRLKERGAQAITLMGTSLSFYQGAAFNMKLTELMRTATGLPVVTMSTAVADGLRAVGARRVAAATAYNDEVNGRLRTFLNEQNIEVLTVRGLGIENVDDVERITRDDLIAFGADVFKDAPDADALLVSCGGLRTLEILAPLEARCGVPVVSSTPHALRAGVRLLGFPATVPGYGRLLAS